MVMAEAYCTDTDASGLPASASSSQTRALAIMAIAMRQVSTIACLSFVRRADTTPQIVERDAVKEGMGLNDLAVLHF